MGEGAKQRCGPAGRRDAGRRDAAARSEGANGRRGDAEGGWLTGRFCVSASPRPQIPLLFRNNSLLTERQHSVKVCAVFSRHEVRSLYTLQSENLKNDLNGA